MKSRSAPASAAFAALAALIAACGPHSNGRPAPPPHRIEVLDGDTLIFDGQLVRIAGIDAPELRPWAHCWAEAGLGGASREALSNLAFAHRREWKLAGAAAPDAKGRIRADLVTPGGDRISDDMVVYGYAAQTDGRWNWCGGDAKLHNPRNGEPAPHGPNLWWPSGKVFDARAGD